MKKLLSCVLACTMLFGTCTTSFASLFTNAEIAYVQGLVDAAKTEISNIVDIVKNGTDAQKEALIDDAKDALVSAGLEEAKLDEIEQEVRDEISEIAGIVEAQDDEAAQAKIDAYIDFLKETLDITDEDEAMIAEIIADVTVLVGEIKGLSKEDVKAAIDNYIAKLNAKLALEYAKLGHKRYVGKDGDLYVALDANVNGIGRQDSAYYELVADELEIDYSINWADIADAELISYQVDASDIILSVLDAEVVVDWSNYFTADQLEIIEAVWEEAANVLAKDWEVVGNAIVTDTAAKIKAAVMEKLPENRIEEADIDAVINFCMPYITRALSYVETEKDAIVADTTAAVAEIDEVVWDFAEKFAYVVVSYLVDTKATIEEIQAINPDATLVVLGMYNNFDGVEIVMNGTTVDAGEYFAYAVDATNIYYSILAATNKNFAFVNIDEADVNGATISVSEDILALAGTVLSVVNNITANADGHVYIKDQILNAFVCDYSAYEQLDETYHNIVCALCGHKYSKELHTFVGNTCDKCGYTKVVAPTPDPIPCSLGGGGGISTYTIKFETNGGSEIDSVRVERNALLAEPAEPTKEGFTFDGWYTDKDLINKYDFSQKVTSSFTLYAKWIENEFANPFSDITKDNWFYDAVMFIYKKGITKGISDTEFAPYGKVTRGQFITMLCRAYGVEEMTGDNFADCGDTWYTGYLAAAKQLGISNGVGDNNFAPEREISREEMVTLIYNYFKSADKIAEETEELSFADSENVSDWAVKAVAYAAKNGIVNGKDNNLFDPTGSAIRAELAQIFYNLLK